MSHTYIVVNQAFCQAHEGYTDAKGNKFGYAVTSDGLYVTSVNSLTEFPELFINSQYLYSMPYVELTPEDFPQTPFNP